MSFANELSIKLMWFFLLCFYIVETNFADFFLIYTSFFCVSLHESTNRNAKVIDGFRLVSVAYELQKVFFIESFLRIKVSMTDMTTWESSGELLQ